MAETDIFQLEEKYKDMTDENLINEALNNQNNAALDCLMGRYKDIVNMKASKFFMVGSEKDDIIQEGYIGLYKAVKSFDKEKQRKISFLPLFYHFILNKKCIDKIRQKIYAYKMIFLDEIFENT